MFSIATVSFREMLGIPELNLGFNSNVPALLSTYLGTILFLNYVLPKFTVGKKQ
tara:strand:+ start:31398 stop:31559 length:162 start_codon:yes stop_codon:yes gene_type:complete